MIFFLFLSNGSLHAAVVCFGVFMEHSLPPSLSPPFPPSSLSLVQTDLEFLILLPQALPCGRSPYPWLKSFPLRVLVPLDQVPPSLPNYVSKASSTNIIGKLGIQLEFRGAYKLSIHNRVIYN